VETSPFCSLTKHEPLSVSKAWPLVSRKLFKEPLFWQTAPKPRNQDNQIQITVPSNRLCTFPNEGDPDARIELEQFPIQQTRLKYSKKKHKQMFDTIHHL